MLRGYKAQPFQLPFVLRKAQQAILFGDTSVFINGRLENGIHKEGALEIPSPLKRQVKTGFQSLGLA